MKLFIGTALISCLLLGSSLLLLNIGMDSTDNGADSCNENSRTDGNPILAGDFPDDRVSIDGNWTETAAEYDWCTGAGTEEDPFVIENLRIYPYQTSGVSIHNTEDHFIIRNVTIKGMLGIVSYFI